MNSVSGIYIILNKKSGRIYIGQAQNINRRWREHRRALNNGKHHNQHLQRAWNKYGESAFKFQVLEYCTIEQLDTREQHFLDIYLNKGVCYNVAMDAYAPNRGLPRSIETRAKIGAGHKNKFVSAETRKKMSEAQKNINSETRKKMNKSLKGRTMPPMSIETRKKISISNTGKTHSIEIRRKMSEAAKARWAKQKEATNENQ